MKTVFLIFGIRLIQDIEFIKIIKDLLKNEPDFFLISEMRLMKSILQLIKIITDLLKIKIPFFGSVYKDYNKLNEEMELQSFFLFLRLDS